MKKIMKIAAAGAVALCCASCEKETPLIELPKPPADYGKEVTKYPQITPGFGEMPVDEHGGRILDFSRVGYRWGDEELPDVEVVNVLTAPTDGSDATKLINDAIREVAKMPLEGRHRGTILLKAGTYNIGTQILLNASGVVLRGEGAATRLVGTGKRSVNIDSETENLITVGGSGSRSGAKPASPNIRDEYVPEGQFWVRVNNAAAFKVMDNVVVYRAVNDKWIADLGMTGIWTTSSVDRQYAERVVTKINRDTLWFENPVPCSIETKYGGGYVYKYSYANRISECGIEDMALESEFFDETNESHCWNGVGFTVAEHCWMKNVTGKYF